jgi:hypothetical protein
MRYSEARGTLIYEKNLKSKISCQTPFKYGGVKTSVCTKLTTERSETVLERKALRRTGSQPILQKRPPLKGK